MCGSSVFSVLMSAMNRQKIVISTSWLTLKRSIKGLGYEEFQNNDMLIDAVIRNFEVIGEATSNIPEEVQEKYPEVEWREAKGFRNVLIHAYFGIDVEAVWDTIEKDIPGLRKHIGEVLGL